MHARASNNDLLKEQDRVAATNEFREYENGIADILSAIVGERAAVQRNVRISVSSGIRKRQIDILVEGSLFGLTEASMIVDCKRWRKHIDVADVDAFIGMVEDVKADAGMLVSASGASEGAVDRARMVRGIRIKAVSLVELNSWKPQGTVFKTVELSRRDLESATKALREIGLRVAVTLDEDASAVQVEVFRHHGMKNPSGDVQQAQHQAIEDTLRRLRISFQSLGQGIVINGGTPSHRWLPVTLGGADLHLRVMAATDADIEVELDRLSSNLGFPRQSLDVVRPNGWPFDHAFLL